MLIGPIRRAAVLTAVTAVTAAVLTSVGAGPAAFAGPASASEVTTTTNAQATALADGHTTTHVFTFFPAVTNFDGGDTDVAPRPDIIKCYVEMKGPDILLTTVGPLIFQRIAFDGVGYCDSQVMTIEVTTYLNFEGQKLNDSVDSRIKPWVSAVTTRSSTDCRVGFYSGHIDVIATMPGGYAPPTQDGSRDSIPVFLACLSTF